MKDASFRPLRADEIDVRIGTINEKGATLLLFKDARVDMNLLDESGKKWKRSHELINGNLFCTISVWDEEIKEWISRQDVGVESNTEKEKGQASDAFKRAGFNFGIGRELYTAPFTWISADNYTGYINKQGKHATYDKFSVTKIEYDDGRQISSLVIKNNKTNKVVFDWSNGKQTVKTPANKWVPSDTKPISDEQKMFIANELRLLHGIEDADSIYKFIWDNYSTDPKMLTQAQGQSIIEDLTAEIKEKQAAHDAAKEAAA